MTYRQAPFSVLCIFYRKVSFNCGNGARWHEREFVTWKVTLFDVTVINLD